MGRKAWPENSVRVARNRWAEGGVTVREVFQEMTVAKIQPDSMSTVGRWVGGVDRKKVGGPVFGDGEAQPKGDETMEDFVARTTAPSSEPKTSLPFGEESRGEKLQLDRIERMLKDMHVAWFGSDRKSE